MDISHFDTKPNFLLLDKPCNNRMTVELFSYLINSELGLSSKVEGIYISEVGTPKPVFPLKQKRTDPNRPDPTKNGNENSAATNN